MGARCCLYYDDSCWTKKNKSVLEINRVLASGTTHPKTVYFTQPPTCCSCSCSADSLVYSTLRLLLLQCLASFTTALDSLRNNVKDVGSCCSVNLRCHLLVLLTRYNVLTFTPLFGIVSTLLCFMLLFRDTAADGGVGFCVRFYIMARTGSSYVRERQWRHCCSRPAVSSHSSGQPAVGQLLGCPRSRYTRPYTLVFRHHHLPQLF